MDIKKKLVAGLAGTTLVLGTTAAWAAWSGSVSSSEARGKAQGISLGTTAPAVTADLYPGGFGDLKVTVTNTNQFKVTLDGLQKTEAGVTPASCLVTYRSANVYMPLASNATPTNNAKIVLASGESTTVTWDDILAMDYAAPDSCQNADLTVPVRITFSQVGQEVPSNK